MIASNSTSRPTTGPPSRLGARRSLFRDRGAVLIVVMAILAAVLLIGVALFTLAAGESDIVEYRTDSTNALWLAEGGLERARVWLSKVYQDDPLIDPVGMGAANQPLHTGKYSYTVTDMSAGLGGLPEFTVLATGADDGAVRQVRAVLTPETFAHFQWFINSQAPDTWFVTGDYFEGPVYINGHLRVDGDPWFGSSVAATGNYIEAPNSHPTFTAGYQTAAPVIPFPTNATVYADIRDQAGLSLPQLPGNGSRYEVVLGRNGNLGTLSYRSYAGSYSNWTNRSIGDLNGAAWFGSTVWIEGTIDGELTIGSANQIWITNDVLYADSSPGEGPNPGCDDVLGLVALNETYVKDTVPNGTDCEIHGILMSLNRRFEVEGWNNPPARGTLTVWGGIIADQAWRVGTYVQDVARSGYDREWHYDPRMLRLFPPFFPMTGNMMIIAWEEVIPPEV
jgi:hypothetical protein